MAKTLKFPHRHSQTFKLKYICNYQKQTNIFRSKSVRITTLLSLRQALLLSKSRVTNTQRESNQRHSKTDTSDAKQALGLFIGEDSVITIGSADGINGCEIQGLSINFGGKGCVANMTVQFRRENLVPDCAGDSVA
jgi:hypothetical protein